MRFKKEYKKLFLDPLSSEKFAHAPGEKVEIVLSPALYWVKKVKLPIKGVREAKKLLPSIFEESLPEGIYSYFTYKSGEDFYIFAYEERKILELLHKVGVAFGEIASVSFAQSLSAFLETPKQLNEKQALWLKDDLVVLVPLSWVDASETVDISGIKISSNTIKLQQFGHIVDKSSLTKVGVALASLAVIVAAEIFIASAKKEEIVALKEEIFSNYKLQSTLMQNRSALEKYNKINKEQKNLRTSMAAFLSLKLAKEQKITQISSKNRILFVTISKTSQQNLSSIKTQLSEKGILFIESLKNDNLTLEVAL